MTDNEAVILDAMKKAGKPIRPGDIASATGLDKKEVAKALGTLKVRGSSAPPWVLLRTGMMNVHREVWKCQN